MTIKKVGIIGQGFVGTALREAFSPHYEVLTYDKFRDDLSTCSSIESVARKCGLDSVIFVCVPTPMKGDGSCDTSIVEEVCDSISYGGISEGFPSQWPEHSEPIIVIKSTIPPGTTKKLRWRDGCRSHSLPIVFNPEFLIERTATEDFKNTKRIILGGRTSDEPLWFEEERMGYMTHINWGSTLREFYLKVFPEAEITETDSTTAELVKYITNCFLATKVSLANEFASLCNSCGVDYSKVIEYATQDERLGKSHWAVPGPDGKKGFGGSCFPKDVNAMISMAESLLKEGRSELMTMDTLRGAWATNLKVRPDRDWEQLKGRAVQ
jgi:nucleotide sugar dehydrogenase